jgi:hypothetical protein
MNSHAVARQLGFFSIALGLAELLAPRQLARAIGVDDDNDTLIRGLGARELASGFAILSAQHTVPSVWSRVAGDAMDLGLLAAAFKSENTNRRRLTAAMVAVAGVAAVDLFTSLQLSRGPRIDPSWRYTPAGGRAGIRRPRQGDTALQSAPRTAAEIR